MEKMLKKPDYAKEILAIMHGSFSKEEMLDRIADYHENDIAEAFELLSESERKSWYQMFGPEQIAEIFSYIDDPDSYLKEALNEEQSLGKDLSASQKEDTVNINTASKEELMTLPGIGESRADAVIACREEKGSFTSIEGIKDAAGIGDGIFNRIKDLITVN